MKITMLGCGTSSGVPYIGCDCEVCRSNDPKNKRTRVSCLVETGGKHILIDTSPDLRQQALANDIRRINAVLYTHEHADHSHGLDDMRSFNYLSGDVIPAYGSEQTMAALKLRFPYAFQPKPEHVWSRPALAPVALLPLAVHEFSVLGVDVVAFEQTHGKMKTLGYRFGDFAYSTDADALPESAFEALTGVEVWMVDCIRYAKTGYGHAYLEKSLEWIARVKPKRAILTHMSHDFDYERLKAELPPGVEPGYDGLTIEV